MEYDVLGFIGRCQPFHLGHKYVVDTALQRAKKVAIVLGSAQQPRTARNPFTTKERIEMISAVYPEEVEQRRIFFCPQVDHIYNMDRWIGGVQSSIMTVANTPFTPDPVRTGLIGHSKDHSSFYLKAFPTWVHEEVANFENINATDIRAAYLANENWENTYGDFLPEEVRHYLYTFEQTDAFEAVQAEHKFIVNYKKQFTTPSDAEIQAWCHANYPGNHRLNDTLKAFAKDHCPKYPPTFYTVDALVVQSGHILLVRRGAMPGKGLWAIPGGFVDPHETSFDAAIRELREETRIAVPEAVLRGSRRSWRVFEDPYRSQRGRTVTTAHHFDLRQDKELPKIKGADDAEKAQWVPIANLTRESMFEDHYDIIETMVGI